MYVPKKNSLRDHIALHICANGPKSIADIAKAFAGYRHNTVSSAVHQLKFYKGVTLEGGIYSLTEELQAHYSGMPLPKKPEVKKEAPEWKPLSAKHIPSMIPPRADAPPLRDISYCSGAFGETNVFHEVR